MQHAESFHHTLSSIAGPDILCKYTTKDESRADLLQRCNSLAQPCLAGIYTDWKNFK